MYLACVNNNSEDNLQGPVSRQKALKDTIQPCQTDPLKLQSNANFILDNGDCLQIPSSSNRIKRDESIERRVKEAKINLEWKIALKLKERMGKVLHVGKVNEEKDEDRPRKAPT